MVRHLARLFVLLLLAPAVLAGGEPVRVALLGDSITAGARIEDARLHLAPQLATHLAGGERPVDVRGFGVGGATLLADADRPWSATPAAAEALAFAPDVAVVILGTNDTCLDERRRCWSHERYLERDAAALVARLRAANADVRVLLASPPAMFPDEARGDPERQASLRERMQRLVRVAAAYRAVARADTGAAAPRVRFVDLGRTLEPGDTLDGVHPSPFGVARLARRLAVELELELAGGAAPELGLAEALTRGGAQPRTGDFHGFRRLDVELALDPGGDGVSCTLVLPDAVRPGAPWVWRARFFGHEPALDLALLDLGFHVAYCDVAGLYGGPAALQRWASFQQRLLALGLARRPVLEGLSRGGLAVLRYGAAYPERVAALYGDNPVVDPRSWPGGRNGARSDADWRAYLAAHGLDEEAALARAPLEELELEGLARAGVPLALVVGRADTVVPPAENADLWARAYAAAGGEVVTWPRPGRGHHPHGLVPVAPLARTLARAGLAANGLAIPRALEPGLHPLPSVEHRGGPAGWGEGTWLDALAHVERAQAAHPETAVVFLGDSLTQGLTGHAERAARPDGERAFDRAFGHVGALSLGLSGDRTEHLLHRIGRPAFAALRPRVVVLQIGVNDVRVAGRTGAEVAAGIDAVVRALARVHPATRVLVCGPFPTGARPDDPARLAVDDCHARLRGLAAEWGERVHLLDLRDLFLDADGTPNARMGADHVHLSAAGNEAWLAALTAALADLVVGRGRRP